MDFFSYFLKKDIILFKKIVVEKDI